MLLLPEERPVTAVAWLRGHWGPSAVPTFMPGPPWRSRAFLCSLVTAHRARSLSPWAPQDTARGLPALARAVSAALTATPAASQCYGNSDGARPWKARLSGRAAACLKSDLEQRPLQRAHDAGCAAPLSAPRAEGGRGCRVPRSRGLPVSRPHPGRHRLLTAPPQPLL